MLVNLDPRVRELLIVDDDASQARLFSLMLEKVGPAHRCHHASSGQKALDFLRRRDPYQNAPRPELIILDLNMPGMDGCAVLHEIKTDVELHSIPVIMFSLSDNAEEINRCYRERANAYICKPADYDGNLHVVRQIERFWFHAAALPA